MHTLRTALLFFVGIMAVAPSGRGERARIAPIHPDTLPTLSQSWRLPASLAPYVTNTYSPRMALGRTLLYLFDHHGRRLAAVNPQTGKVMWHAPVPSRSDRAFSVTPLIDKDRVFVATDGFLYSFDAASGDLKWTVNTKGIPINGLARSKHLIILPFITVTGRQGLPGVNLWAVDSRRARVEWNKKLPGQLAYLAGDADGVYYTSNTGVVLGLTPDRGEPRWQYRIDGQVTSPPLLERGRLYLTALRKKGGWSGTGVYAIDVQKGKLLWQSKLPSSLVSKFLQEDKLIVVEANGKLTRFDGAGKKDLELQLGFGEEPTSLQATLTGNRVYIFTSSPEGNGYIRLVDLESKKILAVANSLSMRVRSMLSGNKLLFFDGADGDVYAIRTDRSERPKRASVSPEQFAQEMLERARQAKAPIKGLEDRLAGLGAKALPSIEGGLASSNPFVVDAAAKAIGLLGNKRSVPALLKALSQWINAEPSQQKGDPSLGIIEALAGLHDSRAIPLLQKLLKSEGENYFRRRGAYVALGAVGSPVALAPLWAFRATKNVPSTVWDPQPFTPSLEHRVEADVEGDSESWPEAIRRETSLTIQTKEGQIFTASLSPYLGGYNDLWVGKSDLAGILAAPIFTNITRAEVVPGKRLRIKGLSLAEKGRLSLLLETQVGGRWVPSKPMRLSMAALSRDSDGDKLPDSVERRLHLCIHDADCDGDGLKDGEDLNPLASGKLAPTLEQQLFREAFFTFYAFLKRRGIVVVDPGEGPSFELYGRKDPILSLRRTTIEKFRKQVGLHAVDFVSFGGPYPEGAGAGDALPQVVWNKNKTEATVGMDVFRSADNAVAYNVTLKKLGKNWVVIRFFRVWGTN